MSHNAGRHRAPGRYNPAAELGQVVTEIGTPLAKGSAVVAASSGLVAAIAIPAQAATVEGSTGSATAPASQTITALHTAAPTAAVTAPATSSTDEASEGFGHVAVEPVAKPTGPSPAELRERAERKAEQEAAEEQERAEAAAREQAEERAESAPSRSQERTAPTQTQSSSSSSETSTPEPAAPAPSAGGVIGIAKQYIGTPYVYGGTTPAGFDCSGFTQYVFAKVGISLPRTAEAQRQMATPVSNPQPGDLVFFGAPAYHMGIYVGDGMMIDSPRSGKSVSVRPVFSGVSGYGRV